MRTAVISFHKNVRRYPKEWIISYKKSILNQTNTDFDILELNYGGGNERIFGNSIFTSVFLNDHAQAHNLLVDVAFKMGYDFVLNSNVDDVYFPSRVDLQIKAYDANVPVISGNYQILNSDYRTAFHLLDMDAEFDRNHNIIAHPVCGYTKKYLEYRDKLISREIPKDDFRLWKRIRHKKAVFKIMPDILFYYRVSELKTKG
jgi:hypothetical protein